VCVSTRRRINFQACSLNHSDISPLVESTTNGDSARANIGDCALTNSASPHFKANRDRGAMGRGRRLVAVRYYRPTVRAAQTSGGAGSMKRYSASTRGVLRSPAASTLAFADKHRLMCCQRRAVLIVHGEGRRNCVSQAREMRRRRSGRCYQSRSHVYVTCRCRLSRLAPRESPKALVGERRVYRDSAEGGRRSPGLRRDP
jgi:hypothetical protein